MAETNAVGLFAEITKWYNKNMSSALQTLELRELDWSEAEPLYPVELLNDPDELIKHLTRVMIAEYRGALTIPLIDDFDSPGVAKTKLGLLVERLVPEEGSEVFRLHIHNPSKDKSRLPTSIDGERKLGYIGGFIVDFALGNDGVVVYDSTENSVNELVTAEQLSGLHTRLAISVASARRKNEEYYANCVPA